MESEGTCCEMLQQGESKLGGQEALRTESVPGGPLAGRLCHSMDAVLLQSNKKGQKLLS